MKEEYFNMIARCRKDVLEQLESLETKGTLYFNRCEETLLELATISNVKNIFGEELNERAYKAYFKKILELYSSEDKDGFSVKSKYEHFLEDCRAKEKKITENLDNIGKELGKAVKKAEEILQDSIELTSKIVTLSWSESLKGLKIKIEGMLAEQTGMESSGQRFGLMDQPLPLSTSPLT